jgi:hypothetical protein
MTAATAESIRRGESFRSLASRAGRRTLDLRRHVYLTFGDRPLGSIRPSEIQAWVRGLEQDLAPSTIGVVYSFLAGIFRAAVRDRLIVASPCDGIRLPKPEPKRVELWRPAAAAAGLGDGVTFHDLRHYYSSLLIQHAESVKVVQRRLGHKSAVETLDTYSHLWPDSEDRTRKAVDQVLGRPAEPGQEAAP